jgi:phage terminase large subunit-like protein
VAAAPAKPSTSTPARWLDLFALLPGYDPVATAPDGWWFDATAADKACRFFAEYLTHIEGHMAGRPLVLEPWQQAVVGCAFGWKRPDGTRRYREIFQFVPRKNGKSTLCGGLVNLIAYCDGEPGAQIYCAAADKDQAALVYRQAKGMIVANSELSAGARIYAATKAIEFPNGGIFRTLTSDADTKHGLNSHANIIDELHAHYSRDLTDVLQTGTGARRQPITWMITTSDFDRESICNEKHDYARGVRDRVIDDPAFLPVIYEATTDDDWTSPATWRKANPNLGVSVSEEYIARECKRAQETPSYENTFKRLHLNIRTQQDVRWLTLEHWDACDGPVDAEALRGRECWAGMDLSTTTDLSALVLLFPREGGYDVLPYFWAPRANAEKRERRDRVPYLTWARQGFVTLTDGDVVDYDAIRARFNELARTYDVRELAIDRWNSTQLQTQLMGDGVEVVPFGQGFASMSAPTKELEKLVIAGSVAHGGNPVLRWMASHVSVETDAAGNLKPSKKKSTERIDGIVALVMGLGRSMVRPEMNSVYQSRGLVIL